jgi:hypothetical protein
MVGLIRYWLAVLLHSQRYFPPVLLFVTGVVVLTANDTGPLIDSYGSAAAVLFLSAIWLTVGLIDVDHPAQRDITVVNARSSTRVLVAVVLVAIVAVAICTVFGLVFPLLSGDHRITAAAVLVGAISQLAAGLTGIAVGLICSRFVVARLAFALPLAIILAVTAYVAPWASPLHALLHDTSGRRPPDQLLGPVGALTAASAALLLVVTALVQAVSTRRA